MRTDDDNEFDLTCKCRDEDGNLICFLECVCCCHDKDES